MTPLNLVIVLALTWFTVSIVDWFQVLTARGRVGLVLVALLLYGVWVFGAITIGR